MTHEKLWLYPAVIHPLHWNHYQILLEQTPSAYIPESEFTCYISKGGGGDWKILKSPESVGS